MLFFNAAKIFYEKNAPVSSTFQIIFVEGSSIICKEKRVRMLDKENILRNVLQIKKK